MAKPTQPPKKKDVKPRIVDLDLAERMRSRRKALNRLLEEEMNKTPVDVRNLSRLMALDIEASRMQYEALSCIEDAVSIARIHGAAVQVLKIGGHISEAPPAGKDSWDAAMVAAAEEAKAAPVLSIVARQAEIVDED